MTVENSMLLNSWPIRVLISRAARAYGFLDPVKLVAKIRGFAQPSEFSEPIELLRAGMLFHARGLVNTKAIQNNLDWIWPYWVERQFNPDDVSFIPRAFSFSHINLTHRNWTAVGRPDVPYYPIVDPRGLVTPLFDGWSLDFWLVTAAGKILAPAKLATFSQTLACDSNLHVRSVATWSEASLETDVALVVNNTEPHCSVAVRPVGLREGWVAVSLRPYNPEGISFMEKIAVTADQSGLLVNGRHPVLFDRKPSRIVLSTYKDGDASQRLSEPVSETAVNCSVGMATAVALFPLESVAEHPLDVRTPIYNELEPKKRLVITARIPWNDALSRYAKLRIADVRKQRLYDLAVANLVLHAPDEVYPGPYTYKRFWFRDAAFVLNAILALGDVERVRRALRQFAPRQRHDGYFLSQEGEWDSNGEAIWTYHRFCTLTGEPPTEEWLVAIEKGAKWIMEKRLPRDSGLPEAGLLPAGFSAEHLGPNDFYYWDDFWAVAGLRCAAEMLEQRSPKFAARCAAEAEDFLATIVRSFPVGPHRRFPGAIPASPRRRMDSGAIGSIVADYPLQLFPPADTAILRTADYLRDHSSYDGGFFQNMIHSGINAYLTLHLAQVRLRAGEVQAAWDLIDRVAALASPTGQWPEAIHPRTFGGCMGDGQHIWAAAEWALMLRACWLRSEDDRIVIAPGVPEAWWSAETGAAFGPTLTRFGAVSVSVRAKSGGSGVLLTVDGNWRGQPPRLDVRLPGFVPQMRAAGSGREEFQLERTP
jgi:hypothetical protein